jgi:uncharacterized protein (TIGR00251 family)
MIARHINLRRASSHPSWYYRGMAILRVHIVPNARSDSVVGMHGGTIKIKLRAPVVEGKANATLIRFLADHFKLPRSSIVLRCGHALRDKLVRIVGLNPEDLRRCLLENRNELRAIP